MAVSLAEKKAERAKRRTRTQSHGFSGEAASLCAKAGVPRAKRRSHRLGGRSIRLPPFYTRPAATYPKGFPAALARASPGAKPRRAQGGQRLS